MKINHTPFDQYLINNYAVNTLINGNISECIKYLRGLFEYGKPGMNVIHDELLNIRAQVPDRYEYIKEKTFSVK
jgi:hypothetical protein